MNLDLSNASLTESELKKLMKTKRAWSQVSFSAVRGMTDSSYACFLKNCHKLLYLDLSFCSNITDQAFLAIQEPHLKILNLKGCEDLTDKALYSISKGCKSLRVLLFAYGSKITDQGLFFFQSTSLVTLDLSRCEKISDIGILHIVEESPHLRSLNILDSPISKKCQKQLRILHPELTILN